MKNKISILENTINNLENILKIYSNNFIFDNNLIYPINLSYKGPICLSNINLYSINLIFCYYSSVYKHNLAILINNNNMECFDPNVKRNLTYINQYKIINYNINSDNLLNDKFKLLQSEYIIFYKINIIDDMMNNDIKKLIFVECVINVNNVYNKINELHFYKCTIQNIDGFTPLEI